jgi:NhaP-type Na+/H+ or K+/H+ antiporter
MDSYLVSMAVIGFSFLLMSWMPVLSSKLRISYPIIYVLAGIILYLLFSGLPNPNPLTHQRFTLHFTELIVIISLMGTGLKIDEPFKLKTWLVPFRLVSIAMVLTIGVVAVACHYYLAFDWPTSLLIGAALAPTDPVLANDVQVGPPLQGDEGRVRFSLTAEAGMNDGMAFPFTWLAIALATAGTTHETPITTWLWKDCYTA